MKVQWQVNAIPIAQAFNVRPSEVIFADQDDPVLEFVVFIFHHGGNSKNIIRGIRRDEGLFRANSEPALLTLACSGNRKVFLNGCFSREADVLESELQHLGQFVLYAVSFEWICREKLLKGLFLNEAIEFLKFVSTNKVVVRGALFEFQKVDQIQDRVQSAILSSPP